MLSRTRVFLKKQGLRHKFKIRYSARKYISPWANQNPTKTHKSKCLGIELDGWADLIDRNVYRLEPRGKSCRPKGRNSFLGYSFLNNANGVPENWIGLSENRGGVPEHWIGLSENWDGLRETKWRNCRGYELGGDSQHVNEAVVNAMMKSAYGKTESTLGVKPHAKRRIKKRGKAKCHRFERWRQRRHSERGGSELKPNCWKDTKRNPAQRKYSLWKELPRSCWWRECIAWPRMRKWND